MAPILSSGQKLLSNVDTGLRGKRKLNNTERVDAISLLDRGRLVITVEPYGDVCLCIAVYDSDSLDLVREFSLPKQVKSINSICVAQDPELIFLDIYDYVYKVNLKDGKVVNKPLSLRFHHPYLSENIIQKSLQIILQKKEVFYISRLSLSENKNTLVADCGIAAPNMPSNLVSWNLREGTLNGQAYTPNTGFHIKTDNRAGTPRHNHPHYLTGNRFGWIRVWNTVSLKLVKQFQLEFIKKYSVPIWEYGSDIEIFSMSVSPSGKQVAVGTYCGLTYIINIDTEEYRVEPFAPTTFNYSKNRYSEDGHWEVTALAFIDENNLISGYQNGLISIWDLSNGRERAFIKADSWKDVKVKEILIIKPTMKAIIIPAFYRDNIKAEVIDLNLYLN